MCISCLRQRHECCMFNTGIPLCSVLDWVISWVNVCFGCFLIQLHSMVAFPNVEGGFILNKGRGDKNTMRTLFDKGTGG